MTNSATATVKIHHNTVKRATRLGVELVVEGAQLRLRNLASSLFSRDLYDSPAEALEEVERGEVDWAEPVSEEDKAARALRRGVMVAAYHDRYSHNPDGPGCGDELDIELRAATRDKDGKADVAKLREVGIANNVWVATWEALNPGMQRMNLSNRLRALLRNDSQAEISLFGLVSRFGVAYKPAKTRRGKKGA